MAVARLETRVLDFSPNSVSTDQSVVSSSNNVITKNSDSRNKSHMDFTLSNEKEAVEKTKVESLLPGQSPISFHFHWLHFPETQTQTTGKMEC